jgi:predicted short-subunit dehydrogenase-like oxidoreductase (DUF2520 family)
MRRRAKRHAKTPVTVIGAGRAGLGLARSLAGAGYSLAGVVARRSASARLASRLLGAGTGTTDVDGAVARATVILICVADAEIAPIVSSLSSRPLAGKIVLHTSGVTGAELLAPLRKRGAAVGCLHPLYTFPDPLRASADLRGACIAVDGDRKALRAARSLALGLAATPLRVPGSARAIYHLIASLMANDLVALLDIGLDLAARRLGMTAARARAAFLPLVRAAVENVARQGPRRALTGPVARGDAGTIARHLNALAREEEPIREIHRLLSSRCVEMAAASRRLDPRRAGQLRRLLAPPLRSR